MKPITKVVSEWAEKYFNDTDIEISEGGNRATYRFTCSDKGDFEYRAFVEIYETRPGLTIFHYAPFKVPQQYRKTVAEALVLANYALVNGAIGMDMQDGEVRYKTSVDVMESSLSVAMINEMVDRGTSILDQYLPALAAIIYAGQSADAAFAKADKSYEEMLKNEETISTVMQDEIRTWDSFSGCDPVRAWAKDIQNALSGKADMPAWEFAGRAAVIVNRDKNYCRELLQRVSADNNMNFTAIAACDVMDMSPSTGLKNMTPALVYLEPGRWMPSSTISA